MTDAPQHSAWIRESEVSHCPWPIFRRTKSDAKLLDQAVRRNVCVPVVGILDEQVHHEVVRQLLDVEVLKHESEVAGVEIRQIVGGESHLEADGLIELLRALEIAGWHEGLDLDGCQIQRSHWDLTFDMSGDRKPAKLAGGRPLDGGVRRLYASGQRRHFSDLVVSL